MKEKEGSSPFSRIISGTIENRNTNCNDPIHCQSKDFNEETVAVAETDNFDEPIPIKHRAKLIEFFAEIFPVQKIRFRRV